LLADPIDAFWPDRLASYEGKRLASTTQSTTDLDSGTDQPDISVLTSALKAALGDEVSEVRATARLTDSAVVLAPSGKGPDLQLQRLMRRSGRGGPAAPPVLEVNPKHAVIEALSKHMEDKERIAEAAATLLDLAHVQEGDLPKDPAGFARRVTALMAEGLG
ncbi:MAG: molecular chaperone HtpG, partial [Acetobacteraceae bacterium]